MMVRILVLVVAVIIVAAGVGVALYLTRAPTSACTLQSKNPLIIDQPEKPDTLDPHVTFSTPGWGIVQQIYQSLVNYNGTGYTNFVPVIAKSWTVSASGFNYTFVLRQDVHFSNGDPVNAYVMWYSLYRAIVMNQAGSFILQENFWLPGLNYYSSASDSANATAWMISVLNSYNFVSPTPAQRAVMAATNQSFVALDAYTLQLSMGYGYLGDVAYANLLPAIAGPIASAVDPAYIQAHGGVTNDTNAWMASHMMGTGPFILSSYDQGTGYLLDPDPNYWARNDAAAEPWNNIIQPARSSVQVKFQSSSITAVSDIKSGTVASVSFAYVGPSQIDDLKAAACVQVTLLNVVYGSTAGGWWIYMNQQQQPFNDIHVRAAVVHAINYTEIIQKAFNGYAQRWVGPVPPGYVGYNPDNLKPYEYNLTLARQEMNQSQWPLPTGYTTPINYMYVKLGDWEQVALLLQADLAKIGLHIVPVGINNIDDLYTEQGRDSNGNCISESTFNGGPFYMGQEFYTSDYISPDDWTQNNALSYGSANDCMARYYNTTVMDPLVIQAAGETNATALNQDYAQITKMMYDNYTVAWLVVPDQFQITYSGVTGFVSNPMGAALPFVVMQNTMYAS